MHRFLQRMLLTLTFAMFASHASAMFIQPDWFDPREPGVGTNRYSYSFNDPVNLRDPGGNDVDDDPRDHSTDPNEYNDARGEEGQAVDEARARKSNDELVEGIALEEYGKPYSQLNRFQKGRVAVSAMREANKAFDYMSGDVGAMVSLGQEAGIDGLSAVPRRKGAPPTLSSNQARLEVMRQAGVPTSQQPIEASKTASGMSYVYEVPDVGGGTRLVGVQDRTLDRSHVGQPHWEAGTIKTDPFSGEIRRDRYGTPRLTNQKSKVDYIDP